LHQSDLPVFDNIPAGYRSGRSIRDGYVRGWGLEFGGLKAKILGDPIYREAVALATGRTVQSEPNRMNVFLLLKFYVQQLQPGHVVEFGAYRGGSAIFMAAVCKALDPSMHVYAFDTFSGMPETDPNVDAHKKADFKDVDYDELRQYAASNGLTNLHFIRGTFEDTAEAALKDVGALRLAHIDCDIRSAVLYSYEVCRTRMVEGGYLVFDDALYSSCLGATEVVEDVLIRRDGLNSEQIYPQFVFRAGLK
jgi:cephalosporin hydroxylase